MFHAEGAGFVQHQVTYDISEQRSAFNDSNLLRMHSAGVSGPYKKVCRSVMIVTASDVAVATKRKVAMVSLRAYGS